MKEFKEKQKTAKDLLKGCSYAKGGKVGKSSKKGKAPSKEEAKESPSEKKQEAKALKEVGKVDGNVAKNRMDKLARGGKAGKKHKGKTQVNVMVQPGQQKVPVPVPVPVNPKVAVPGNAQAAPIEPPPPGAGMPPIGAKRGGKIKKAIKKIKRAMGGKIPHMTEGAGGGLGRMAKAKLAAKDKSKPE